MEQIEAVWSGKMIAQRANEVFDILLYQIDGFFVEVYYHRENNYLRKFESITNKNQLLVYGNQLDSLNLL
ncbi:MAG TPA: hypothetical protein VK492_08950 [Chitinophagaceae bacterium]|nr:hypothetical protein [Chitinophagaceae bacterium]